MVYLIWRYFFSEFLFKLRRNFVLYYFKVIFSPERFFERDHSFVGDILVTLFCGTLVMACALGPAHLISELILQLTR